MSIAALLKNPKSLADEMAAFFDSKESFEQGLAHLSYGNGVMTAAIVSPEFIPAQKWQSLIIGSSAALGSKEDVEILKIMLSFEYQKILGGLMEGAFEPLFWEDEDERVITKDWAQGFEDGTYLCYEAWAPFLEDEGRILAVLLNVLRQSEEINKKIAGAGIDPSVAFDQARYEIQDVVCVLYDQWAKARFETVNTPRHVEKVGRNEPCPCGSGKKYKKCCLN